jgi:hypothetical protein
MIKATHKQNQLRDQIAQLEGQIFQLLQTYTQVDDKANIINQLQKLKQEVADEISKLEGSRIRQRKYRERTRKKVTILNRKFDEEDQAQRVNDVLFKVVVCSEREFESFLIHHHQLMIQNQESLGKLLHLRSTFARSFQSLNQAEATALIRSSLEKLICDQTSADSPKLP